MKSTITITFSESVENHVGNQQIGTKINNGISVDELIIIKNMYEKEGYICNYYDLSSLINNYENAGLLVIRNYLKNDNLFNILSKLNWDKKVMMKGRVVNKHARYNLCFSNFEQEPNYEDGKGRVYDFSKLPELDKIRNDISKYIDNICINVNINAEGNYYYDNEKCYIGLHGDTERRLVIGLRLGDEFPLFFRGYHKKNPISDFFKINLNGGDLYYMSDKAVGYDWRKQLVPTLRHCAGNNFTEN